MLITNLVREKRNTLSIHIDKLGEMQIKAPYGMPLNQILEFVNKKEKWIIKKQTEIKNVLKLNEPVLSYKKILYMGNCYNIIADNQVKEIYFEDKNIIIPDKFSKNKLKYIQMFLKNASLNVIENRVLFLSKTFNLNFNNLKLTNSKTRWGSCNESAELTFNWRLIMLPPKAIDYVVIHELAHLLEFNHSQKFWKIVQKMMPDYIKYRDLVKNCNYILTLFR